LGRGAQSREAVALRAEWAFMRLSLSWDNTRMRTRVGKQVQQEQAEEALAFVFLTRLPPFFSHVLQDRLPLPSPSQAFLCRVIQSPSALSPVCFASQLGFLCVPCAAAPKTGFCPKPGGCQRRPVWASVSTVAKEAGNPSKGLV
jgi:hypothetical protein